MESIYIKKRKTLLLDKNPYATIDIQLRKLVNSIEWDIAREGLELSEVRHRVFVAIWYTAHRIGLELRKTDRNIWYIKAFDDDSGSIKWEKLTLNKAKPYVLEIAYQKGLAGYITNNQVIINILNRVYNRQMLIEI